MMENNHVIDEINLQGIFKKERQNITQQDIMLSV